MTKPEAIQEMLAARDAYVKADRNAIERLMAVDFAVVRERAYSRWLAACRAFRTSSPISDSEAAGG